MKCGVTIWLIILLTVRTFGQTGTITGMVYDEQGQPLPQATVAIKNTALTCLTSEKGEYRLEQVPYGTCTVVAFSFGLPVNEKTITLASSHITLDITLKGFSKELDAVTVSASSERTTGITNLNAVENFGVYEGKKTEVVVMNDITANTATNNPRQIYSKVTGLNIWESDGAGLQLGIGGRGLSPNRTSHFNVRQNGYDISADALGYPESYYAPPAEALERIEIVRGAASLQYGTQFGGLLNFRFKKGPDGKRLEFTTRQTIGSWGFYGTFNSVGGTVANGKLNYYAYYNFKRGDGYRENSDFDYHNAYASVHYQINPFLLLNLDVTRMNYLAHQPGGLTDKLFEMDDRQSVRERNWFRVNWNLLSLNLTYRFSDHTQLNLRNFGLVAARQSLGNLERIHVADFGGNRTLIDGEFKNVGHESRLLHRYTFGGKQQALVAGFRIYRGTSTAKQGEASNGKGPDFYFLHPEDLENSDYTFPNENYSAFVENIFDISPKFSITPGIRFENIRTFSEGYYKQIVYDMAGNIVTETTYPESQSRKRSFVLLGIGLSFKPTAQTEIYGNISQNYRAINFTDLRIVNPNFVIDPNIQDEKGYTADLGIRGKVGDIIRYEATLFYLAYKGKIGQVLRTDTVLYNDYRFRGNISDARNAGIEAFAEADLLRLIHPQTKASWLLFVNASAIDARYINSKDAAVRNNKVEMVPPFMLRTGTTFQRGGFSSTLQVSHVAEHFSDASNARRTASAVEGIIPAYTVIDLTARYHYKQFALEASCNNLLDARYFTRRAESYPGPGIIPSDGRAFYLTLQVQL